MDQVLYDCLSEKRTFGSVHAITKRRYRALEPSQKLASHLKIGLPGRMPNSSKNWCWTYNRPDETPDEVWDQLVDRMKSVIEEDGVNYLVFQAERGQQGREHLQGYIMLDRRCTLATVKRDFFHVNEIHLESARGSPSANKTYCTKNDGRVAGPFEFGTLQAASGARNDLYEAAVTAQTRGVAAVAADMPELYIRYHRGLNAYSQLNARLNAPAIRDNPCTAVIWGSTGLGKSHAAFSMDNPADTYVVPIQNKGALWFDGYEAQRTIIFDDFDPGTVPYRTLLRLLDRYRLEISVKGGFALAQWRNILITSNHPPSIWYPVSEAGQYEGGPLERRLELIYPVENRLDCNAFAKVFQDRFYHEEASSEVSTPLTIPEVIPEVGGNTVPPPQQPVAESEILPQWAVDAQNAAETLFGFDGGFDPDALDAYESQLDAELAALGVEESSFDELTEPFGTYEEE